MTRYRFFFLFLAFMLIFLPITVVLAVPPLPTTLHGKVQAGGSDVPDGTRVSAWMGSSEAIAVGTPLSFPSAGVSITFSTGCSGEVTVLHQAGQAQVISQGGYSSVYAMDVRGLSDWVPPDDPATEGQPITLKISDTIAATTTWSMGASTPLTLTVDSLVGDPPYSPVNVALLGQVWDIDVACSGFTATATFAYDETWLAGIDETDIVGMARYDAGYNRWEYIAGTVDTGANTVTISDVTAFSQWRILASAPPKPVVDLSAAKSGSDLILDWSAVAQDIKGQAISGVTYHIYRAADDPYFTPGATPYATIADTTFTDSGALGDPGTNYFYVVTALDGQGRESALSDRLGIFHIALAAGWNVVSLPLVPGAIGLDDVIGNQLTGTCDSATADRVLSWDASAQQYEMAWYCDCDEWGEPWDNHWLTDFDPTDLTFGPDVGVWIQNRSGGEEDLAVIGLVSAVDRMLEVGAGWRMLGSAFPGAVALDKAAIPATGTCDSATADRVLVWNSTSGAYEMAWYCDCDEWGEPWDNHWLTGFDPTTLQLVPGRGFWFQNRHAPFTWLYPNPGPQ